MRYLVLVVLGLLTFHAIANFIARMSIDKENYSKQSQCISKYIASGIERKDIILIGTDSCGVK
ncbi:MAG: hypothetical protein ACRDCE_20455 [Cetobacterium sp.]|uniref:hypothetical protein n=1 Tax=Cetobacterium sp. TaxID=2071632 RepID=UPI003EE531FA